MAYSAATYKGDGSQSTFMIPFDYLQKDFVKVTINEVDKVYAQDYRVDGRELSFPTAPPSGSIIKIYRETPTDRMVKWNEGSVLTSSNMTTQQIQELHLIEETTYNLNISSIIKTEDGHKWEGQYLPITHVGDPTDDSDAVNLGTIKKEETGFLASVRKQLDKWLADLGTTYNNYSKSLKESFDSHTSSLKNQFDSHTASLLSDFNDYKNTLKTNFDSYTNTLSTNFNDYKDTLLSKYNEYLTALTATKDAVKDSEANAKKSESASATSATAAKSSEVNAKASEVAAAESAKQAANGQINADWNETNADSKAFIKNKPDVLLKSGGTATGTIIAPSFQTGTDASHYLQCRKFRGSGDVDSYNHAIDFGYSGHNTVDFYEYGGVWNFYKCTSGKAETSTLVGTITATAGWNGLVKGQDITTYAKKSDLSSSVPTGVVQAFAGRTTPQGWLLCDGSAVSRTDYAALFAVIGTTYGAGDGSTTFNLPNLVDKFIEGSATAGTVKSAGLPNITGAFNLRPVTGGQNVTWTGSDGAIERTIVSGDKSDCVARGSDSGPFINVQFNASKSSAIYGNSTTVQPPALTMRYIIKY